MPQIGQDSHRVALSSPGGATFHRYLSPAGYAARFGATRSTASRVRSWLRSEGFTAVHADAQRRYVRATAATSRIEAAFGVRLRLYKSSATVNAGRYPLHANDRSVSLPSSLAGGILGVTALDNAAPVLPLDRPNARPAGATSARAASGGNPACPGHGGAAVTASPGHGIANCKGFRLEVNAGTLDVTITVTGLGRNA